MKLERSISSLTRRAVLTTLCATLSSSSFAFSQTAPVICTVQRADGAIHLVAHIPSGYQYVVLDQRADLASGAWTAHIGGETSGSGGIAIFQSPAAAGNRIFRVRLLLASDGPTPEFTGAPYIGFDYSSPPDSGFCHWSFDQKAGHLLNRAAYGPSHEAIELVREIGLTEYIEIQLTPASSLPEESPQLLAHESALFEAFQPAEERILIQVGAEWRYLKGTAEPPATWRQMSFDDSAWLLGRSGFGYGDDDDETVLDDMRRSDTSNGYLSLYVRRKFAIQDLEAARNLVLRMDYDDGFVAYLNGVEVARANVSGAPPRYNQTASQNHNAGDFENFDLANYHHLLAPGENILAVQLHNVNLSSSDATLKPVLLIRDPLPVPPVQRILGIRELQQLAHLRGIYSRRQLQSVLAEFWENHFTTDADKVEDYLDDLENSDGGDAMGEGQAGREAAQMEFKEYQFFYDHALGHFGDLLLYSASSPPQLIYLDNVLNRKGEPNENYAREILELFAFGVDNRYSQRDIEELARVFTGWTVRKLWPQEQRPFPESTLNPEVEESARVDDNPLVNAGEAWRYFKGTAEPSPGLNGAPGLGWTQAGYNDNGWFSGATGIGYGDNDDATVLNDMRGGYSTVYLRKTFTVASLEDVESLLFSIYYDDAFIAYLNGVEIGRSRSAPEGPDPAAFNDFATGNHEVDSGPDTIDLDGSRGLIRLAPEVNVLAIQILNVSLNSSDLSAIPRLVDRRLLPGSIENGDPNGEWVFRFDPDEHDLQEKIIFEGSPYEIRIPGRRSGLGSHEEAITVIQSMVDHPSTSEFISLKLINKFVSDEITLESYRDGSAPASLRQLMDQAIAAWRSTSPAGHIETVMRTILDPEHKKSAFWTETAYRAKIKTPIEFINSTVRAVGANTSGSSLPGFNLDQGMELFTRDDPDGWSEIGFDWIDTATVLQRIRFARTIAAGNDAELRWDIRPLMTARDLITVDDVLDYFDALLFQGALPAEHRRILIEYVSTDESGNPSPLMPGTREYFLRLQDMVGLLLSTPQWNYQ